MNIYKSLMLFFFSKIYYLIPLSINYMLLLINLKLKHKNNDII